MRQLVALVVCVFILSVGADGAEAQPCLLERSVSHFAVSGSIEQAISKLASAVGGFMAVESVRPVAGAVGPENVGVTVSVESGTVREILDALVAQDKRYSYLTCGEWINLVPAGFARDPSYIYNRRIQGDVTVSTDSARNTQIMDWERHNGVVAALLVMGDMKSRLPVAAQTVTLVNPTYREYTNLRMRLCGRNRWSASCESDKNGKVRIIFSYFAARTCD